MNRSSGFYWIKQTERSDWEVAIWSDNRKQWEVYGDQYYTDAELWMICENKIQPPF